MEKGAPQKERKGILDEMDDLEAKRKERKPEKKPSKKKGDDLDLGRIF